MEQWYAEWERLHLELPPYPPRSPAEETRALEMVRRARSIHAFMHGYGPEPPEVWSPSVPATPEEAAEARAWREAQFQRMRAEPPPGPDAIGW